MFEFISSYPKLFLGVFTPLIMGLGYFYRARKDKSENLKKALYIILEIWHRMAILYRRNCDDYFDVLIAELMKKVPEEGVTEEDYKAMKEHFTPILMKHLHKAAFSDIEHYQDSFDEAVKLISINDPFFAYHIGSGGKTKKYLDSLDCYLEDALKPFENNGGDSLAFSNTLKGHMSEHASLGILSGLEDDIKRLSYRIGVMAFIQSFFVIRKRKSRLQAIETEEISDMVNNLVLPAMEKHTEQINKAS